MLSLLEYYVLKNGSEYSFDFALITFRFWECAHCSPNSLPHLYQRNHLPPVVPHPDVQLEFQLDRPFRPVIERLKALSPTIYLEGSMAGELVLRIDNDAVAIKTFYDKLIPRVDDEASHSRTDVPASCTLKVDSKKLLASLQWQSSMTRSSVSSYILCMIENEMLVVHVLLNPEDVGFFTYYIPVHYLSHDNMMD